MKLQFIAPMRTQVCRSERSASGVEESTHFVDVQGKIGAKILRLALLAQDDNVVQNCAIN